MKVIEQGIEKGKAKLQAQWEREPKVELEGNMIITPLRRFTSSWIGSSK